MKPEATVPILRENAGGQTADDADPAPRQLPRPRRGGDRGRARGVLTRCRARRRATGWRWRAGWSTTDNPLTARVIANRYWEQIFGIGIVATSEEFGSQGEPPSHPELLDWLATELVRLKWDLKAFVKLLVTSAAYRQSSQVTPELLERDPDNRLLARGPRFRLSAEMVRDQALSVSGLLSRARCTARRSSRRSRRSGLTAAFGSGIDWQTSTGEDRYRRGLYTDLAALEPVSVDGHVRRPQPRGLHRPPRSRTNTPLQALVTLNDPVYVEAAQALARRMAAAGTTTAGARRAYGFRALPRAGRPTRRGARPAGQALRGSPRRRSPSDPTKARQMATDPLGPAPEGCDVAELAAWTVVGNVLLNLDEMLMKR